MSTRDIIIFILIVVDLLLALWVHSLEKTLDDLLDIMHKYLDWHKEQRDINRSMLDLSKNLTKVTGKLSKQSDEMLETQAKLTELGNETYTKYLEVQAQINGIKFELDQKDLVAEYCANDALATEAVLIDGEEEE